MDKVDQFESAFRSAAKEVFHYRPLAVASVLVMSDLTGDAAASFAARVKTLHGRVLSNYSSAPESAGIGRSTGTIDVPRRAKSSVERESRCGLDGSASYGQTLRAVAACR